MMNQLLYIIFSLFFSLDPLGNYNPQAGTVDLINDGPYISLINNKLKVKWIENSVCKEDFVKQDNFNEISKKFGLSFNYNDLTGIYRLKPECNQTYINIDSISVISDIHGEYNAYIDLLKGIGIVDKNLKWNFGTGHLVVLGDVFDRGDMVTEILWHLFGLEKQAERAGGVVHVLLGNHEFMALRNDLGETNEKYRKIEKLAGIRYADLYSERSVLGRWLRTKPVIITINDLLFVHGGISMEMALKKLKIRQINKIFTNEIIGKSLPELYQIESLKFLNQGYGPIWYRGYFNDTAFCESKIDSILTFYGKKHMVVGHTPKPEITSLFHNKILGADAGIMNKQPGEILIYKYGSFYKCLSSGQRIKL
jgi:hypothetical protein